MSFGVWFKQWCRSFYRLIADSTSKRKSGSQLQKERERGMGAMHPSGRRLYKKRRVTKRRNSHSAYNRRMTGRILEFVASTLAVILLPFGLFHWGYVNTVKSNKTPMKKSQVTTVSNETPITRPRVNHETASTAACANIEHGEDAPRSIPKNERDQYVRKRMIIAGASYCDKNVLARLGIGSYLDIVAECDNPYDKDAVKLLYVGEKVGYISRKDNRPFAAALRLGRKMYGVITDIDESSFPAKYEFEAWFESR